MKNHPAHQIATRFSLDELDELELITNHSVYQIKRKTELLVSGLRRHHEGAKRLCASATLR